MAHVIRHGRYWMLSVCVAGALGFGAAQALASPAEPAEPAACDPVKCRANCRAMGQTGGACFMDQCFCYIT